MARESERTITASEAPGKRSCKAGRPTSENKPISRPSNIQPKRAAVNASHLPRVDSAWSIAVIPCDAHHLLAVVRVSIQAGSGRSHETPRAGAVLTQSLLPNYDGGDGSSFIRLVVLLSRVLGFIPPAMA